MAQIDIDVECKDCGGTLDAKSRGSGTLEVEFCTSCEEEVKKEAHDEGYAEAKKDFG